jgi:carboxymethylenebutenolidase
MEAFGLTAHIKEICERLAGAGYAALAPDLYQGAVYDYADMQGAIRHLTTLKDEQMANAIGVSLDWLAAKPEVDEDRLGTMGFCMGGRLAFLGALAHPQRVKTAICFYGGGIGADKDALGRAPLLPRIAELQASVLLHYGTEDPMITPQEHGRLACALSTAKKRYALHVYPQANHGFMCPERTSYHAVAASQAWQVSCEFLKQVWDN